MQLHAKYQMSGTTGSGGTNFEQKLNMITIYIYIQPHAKCQVSRTTG